MRGGQLQRLAQPASNFLPGMRLHKTMHISDVDSQNFSLLYRSGSRMHLYLEMTRELSLCFPLSWSLWMLPTPLLDIPSSRSLLSYSSTFSFAWLTSRPSRADRSSASSRRLRSSSSSPRNCSRLRWRRTRSVTRLFTWIGKMC